METDTGKPAIEEPLQNFLVFCSSPALDRLISAFESESVTRKQLPEYMPEGVFQTISALCDPVLYYTLLETAQPEICELLERAKELYEEFFTPLLRFEAFRDLVAFVLEEHHGLDDEKAEDDEGDGDKRESVFQMLDDIEALPMWFGQPPELLPMVRFKFTDSRNRTLLDTVFAWNRMLYVIVCFLDVLVEQMEDCAKMREHLDQDTLATVEFASAVEEIEESLPRLAELAAQYEKKGEE